MDEIFFQHLNESWDQLIEQSQALAFRQGQVLFYEGHQPYGVFIILQGHIGFTRNGLTSGKDHLSHLPKGLVLGADVFFDQAPYCCTCTATSSCKTLFITKTQLLPFIKKKEQSDSSASPR